MVPNFGLFTFRHYLGMSNLVQTSHNLLRKYSGAHLCKNLDFFKFFQQHCRRFASPGPLYISGQCYKAFYDRKLQLQSHIDYKFAHIPTLES